MPLITSNLAASKAKLRESPWWEQGILGVVNGGGKIADSAAGLMEKAGKLAVERNAIQNLPVSQRPQPSWTSLAINASPIARMFANRFGDYAKDSNYLPAVSNLRNDIQKTQKQLEPELDLVGKTAAAVSSSLPDLMLSGPSRGYKAANFVQSIARGYGSDELEGSAASLAMKGNSLASNLGAQGIQELVTYINNLFK